MKHAPWPKLACAGVVAFLLGFASLEAVAAPSGWLNVDGLIRFNAGGGGSVDWANSGPAGIACANGGVNLTGTGGLFNCGRPRVGSAPPRAPILTPAAAADKTIISAAFIVDPISGDAAGCGGNDPTILTGSGPKNGNAIGSYTIGAGTVPPKTQLSNVYAVSHTKGDGHPEVYFGAERLVNNGDSHMDFEFLQSVIGRTAACGGRFTGHRTEGDLLVAVDFTNGGALAGFSVYQWHCAAEPGPQPADGTVCDPGTTAHYQQNLAPAFAALTVNAANVSCGGWICRDQIAGNSTTVSANDLLEGGVDLEGIPFVGCFNTFLPHTRTAQSFTSVLKDFAGPINFHSCRDPGTTSTSAPTGAGVAPGTPVTDTVTVSNGGAGPAPTGTITFFLCAPNQVTTAGCPSGGSLVGAVKPVAAGTATSDPILAGSVGGKYCWRTVYTPDSASAGIYPRDAETNATTECFFDAAPVSLPNTGGLAVPADPWLPLQALVVGPGLLLAMVWKRSRSAVMLLIAGVIAGSSPQTPIAPAVVGNAGIVQPGDQTQPSAAPLQLDTVKAKAMGWRLVIPRIGVDALIQSVGRDRNGAMSPPSRLDVVGWYRQGPSPGRAGDAVIDGHFGLPAQPAVFRNLRLLRPGDAIQVIWPDGRMVAFRVASSEVVDAKAHPTGLFGRSGHARLSLITCSGDWDEGLASYSDRLIVTAVRL